MVLRTQVSGSRVASAVVDRKAALGMLHLRMWSEVQRSLLEVQELRTPQGYECGKLGCWWLRSAVGSQ